MEHKERKLSEMDDAMICKSKAAAEEKIYVLSERYGTDVRKEMEYRKGRLYFHGHRFYSFRSKSMFSADVVEIRDGMLCLAGRIWCPFADELEIYFEDEQKRRTAVVQTTAEFRKAPVSPEEKMHVRVYEVQLPLEGVRRYRVYGQYREDNHRIPLHIRAGKYSHLSHAVEELYYEDGGYMVGFSDGGTFWISPARFFSHIKRELKILMRCLRDHKFAIAGYRILSRIVRPFLRRERWIVMERIYVAGDNAECFYEFLKEHEDKDIKSYFAILKESPDYKRMKQLGGVIAFRGFKYKLNMLLCKYIVSSQAEDNIFNAWDKDGKYIRDLYKFRSVFLQHGIIKADLSAWLNKFNKNLGMFVTSAEPEYRSVLQGGYFYDKSVVKLTGLPRYDRLKQNITPEKTIVFMPTWRYVLAGPVNPHTGAREYNPKFRETEYFQYYQKLIQDECLIRALKRKGYTGKFVLHPHHMVQMKDFSDNETIRLVRGSVDYPKEFEKNALLVTDFSSVAFDFAYLKKPVIYTHFDEDSFFEGQIYDEGYFDYERDGLGPVCYDYDATLQTIINYVERDCRLEEKYNDRICRFYRWFDCGNCRRVYEEIRALDL